MTVNDHMLERNITTGIQEVEQCNVCVNLKVETSMCFVKFSRFRFYEMNIFIEHYFDIFSVRQIHYPEPEDYQKIWPGNQDFKSVQISDFSSPAIVSVAYTLWQHASNTQLEASYTHACSHKREIR